MNSAAPTTRWRPVVVPQPTRAVPKPETRARGGVRGRSGPRGRVGDPVAGGRPSGSRGLSTPTGLDQVPHEVRSVVTRFATTRERCDGDGEHTDAGLIPLSPLAGRLQIHPPWPTTNPTSPPPKHPPS